MSFNWLLAGFFIFFFGLDGGVDFFFLDIFLNCREAKESQAVRGVD